MLYYFHVYSYKSEFQTAEPMHAPSIYTCCVINYHQKKSRQIKKSKFWGILFSVDWGGYNFYFRF